MKIKAIKNKQKKMINPISILLAIPSCILWSAFGFEINELVVILPNMTELIMLLIQLIVYYYLPKPVYNLEKVVVEMTE